MSYLGSWKIDDALTFYCNTHTASTGAETDGDAAPTYRIYENETATPILTGTMALLDGDNTVGFYSEQITLSAANGFEKGKCYCIRISATVATIAGAWVDTFQIEAEVDANTASGKVDLVDAPNATAVTAFRTEMEKAGTSLATLLTRLSAVRASYLDALAGFTTSLLAVLRALARADVAANADIAGTHDPATDSEEALRNFVTPGAPIEMKVDFTEIHTS